MYITGLNTVHTFIRYIKHDDNNCNKPMAPIKSLLFGEMPKRVGEQQGNLKKEMKSKTVEGSRVCSILDL